MCVWWKICCTSDTQNLYKRKYLNVELLIKHQRFCSIYILYFHEHTHNVTHNYKMNLCVIMKLWKMFFFDYVLIESFATMRFLSFNKVQFIQKQHMNIEGIILCLKKGRKNTASHFIWFQIICYKPFTFIYASASRTDYDGEHSVNIIWNVFQVDRRLWKSIIIFSHQCFSDAHTISSSIVELSLFRF